MFYYVQDMNELATLMNRNNLDGILFTNPKEAKEELEPVNPILRKALTLRTLIIPPMEDLLMGMYVVPSVRCASKTFWGETKSESTCKKFPTV